MTIIKLMLGRTLLQNTFKKFNPIFLSVANSHATRKKKEKPLGYHKTLMEETKKKIPKIPVWPGMTISQLAIAANRLQQDIEEAMLVCELDQIDDIPAMVRVLKALNLRAEVVPAPEEKKEDDIDFESYKVQGKKLMRRPPVVTIMGHVDHGKTTLLDSLRKSEIVKQEHGGITQHIGAFVVYLDENKSIENTVTFLDTPGHAAFKSMRERGANVTDVVILVVAADDGVMEQTIESIQFAKAANVPLIIAVNKIDKVSDLNSSLDLVKSGLNTQGIIFEEDGGEYQAVKISALKGSGISEIKEAVLAQAELLELKSYVDASCEAVVIESTLHPHRGKLATLLVLDGSLKRGDYIVAGSSAWAKVRSMFDEWGNVVNECKPGFPVQVIGWRDDVIPEAGEKVYQMLNEKVIKEVVKSIKAKLKTAKAFSDAIKAEEKSEEHLQKYKKELAELRAAGVRYKRKKNSRPREKQLRNELDEKTISVLVKCDVNGSLEVLLDVFNSFPNDVSDVQVDLVHFGVGSVTENDVELVSCFSNSIIYCFNIAVDKKIASQAKELDVQLKTFKVVYHLVDDLKKEINKRLPLKDVETILGEAVVQEEFVISEGHLRVPIAGSRCIKGTLQRKNYLYKIERNNKVVASDLKMFQIKHIKENIDTVTKDMECGLRFEGVENTKGLRFQKGDIIKCYDKKQIPQETIWSPPGF